MDNNRPKSAVGVKKPRDVVIGLCVVFLALMFAGPGVIRQIMCSNFLAMDGDYLVHSPNFAVSAETLFNDNGWVTAEVVIKNVTNRVISGVRANALLDESLRPILAPGSASGLYFYDPGATGNWRILLRDIFHPPVINLAPVSTPVDELSNDESSGLSVSRTFFVDAKGLSTEQKAALLVAPIKVKIWHDGGTEFLTVIPVPKPSAAIPPKSVPSPDDEEEDPEDWYIRYIADKRGDVSAEIIALDGTEAPPFWKIHYASTGKTVELAGGSPEIMQNGDVLYAGSDGYLHRLSPDGTDVTLAEMRGWGLHLDPSERWVAYERHISGEYETLVTAMAVYDLTTGEDKILYQPDCDQSVGICGWYQDKVILDIGSKTLSDPNPDKLSLYLLSTDGSITKWEQLSDLPRLNLYHTRSFDRRFLAYQAGTEPTSVIIINLETLELQTVHNSSEPRWTDEGLTVVTGGERKLIVVQGF